MPVKDGLFRQAELLIEHVNEQRLAGHAIERCGPFILCFHALEGMLLIVRHAWTTCPSLCCNSFPSSPRPRLIRLFTVPSGIFSTAAISL